MARRYLVAAAVIQIVGAACASLYFLVGVWNFVVGRVHRYPVSNDDIRTLPWVIAPLSLAAAIAMLRGSEEAIDTSRWLALSWPIVPLLDLILVRGSLHGGELGIMAMIAAALPFTALVWWLTGKSRNATPSRAVRSAGPAAPGRGSSPRA